LRIAHFYSRNAVSFSSASAFLRILQHQTDRELVYRPFQFEKRTERFIGAHNKTLSVAAMRESS
jgi:hypothetical protein